MESPCAKPCPRSSSSVPRRCPPTAQDFWAHWGDGKAELNGYALKQPRYGAVRTGTAVLIFVTEDFSDSLRVKADPGKHPASDVYPVLKLNAVRDFQTGIYDYNVMTSTFLRVAPGLARRQGQLLEPGVVRPRLAPGRPARREAGRALPQLLRRRGGRRGRPRVPEGRRLRGRAAGPAARLERRVPEAGGEPRPCRSCRACSGRASTTSRSPGRRPRSRAPPARARSRSRPAASR